MIVGLLSDTHGNLARTQTALELLRSAGSEIFVHCGDIGSEGVLDLLLEERERGLTVHAVAGNVDEWEPEIKSYASSLGLPLPRSLHIRCDKLRCAVTHGHHPDVLASLCASADLDVVFTGHTHIPRDERVGRVRVINPGAVHRASPPGVSVFNTASGELRFLSL